ncbi:MAG: hypothetical protein RLY97_900 [Pseudomonadota bacterium]|jgi:L-seryl-tRNA(Ser) seleniumtransferase
MHNYRGVKHAQLPSVDAVLRGAAVQSLLPAYGHVAVVEAIRAVLAGCREQADNAVDTALIEGGVTLHLRRRFQPHLRRVFNLTGTVLHTNLGRAPLAESAISAASLAMRYACNLEYDLANGARGERDALVEELLIELTGAEAALVVNNNAAAVLLVLAALARGKEVVLSRGEMIEIGGSFRIPDVLRSAGARVVEVGTTNRTHAADYAAAIGPKTAALMKVHASNYRISGFTAAVGEAELAQIAHAHGLPLIVDLGAGSLLDLRSFGLPQEPVVRDVVAKACDIVTFSADKLLGGPQAGLIVGSKALIAKIKKHPLKRALRVDKATMAALEATLLLYRRPDLLAQELPALRLLTRTAAELHEVAARMQPVLAAWLGAGWRVEVADMASQVGSGSMPVEILPSAGLVLRVVAGKSGTALQGLAAGLRALPVPVIGRISGDALLLDMRCLEDEADFSAQFMAEEAGVEPT